MFPEPADQTHVIDDENYIAPPRPKWSVQYPGKPGAYVRFTTAELIALCEKLNAAGLIGLMHRLDLMDPRAIHECAMVGVKLDEGVGGRPYFEAMPLSDLKNVLLEALAQRNFGKSLADVEAEMQSRISRLMQDQVGRAPTVEPSEQRDTL